MANYAGYARSNYFQVKDGQSFKEDMERLELRVVDKSPEQGVAIVADGREDGWPSSIYDEDADDFLEVNVADEVAKHLADGQVAILMEVGHEKFCYVTGFALAVNSAGEIRRISLDDIFAEAEALAGPGVEVTDVAY